MAKPKRDAQPKAAPKQLYRVRLNADRREAFLREARETGRTGNAAKSVSRQEKGALLRSLGFSNKDIHDRNMRDWSGKRIEAAIAARQRTISDRAISRRTEAQTKQLSAIRQHRAEVRANPTKSAVSMDTPVSRYDQFARWSSDKVGFPSAYQRYIWQLNDEHYGGDKIMRKEGSYGYRVFYGQFVKGRSEAEAIKWVEDHDS